MSSGAQSATVRAAAIEECRQCALDFAKEWKKRMPEASDAGLDIAARIADLAALAALAAQPPAAPVEPSAWHCPACEAAVVVVDDPTPAHERSSAATSELAADSGTIIRRLRQLVSRVEYRVEVMEERDGKEGAITGPGIGIGYLFAKDLVKVMADAATYIEGHLPALPQTPLIKGAVYDLGRFGPAEYVGLDEYHGETTHQFRTSDRRPRYVKPDELASLLTRPMRGSVGNGDVGSVGGSNGD